MEFTEEIRLAKEVIQAFLKAKKNLRIYPQNNPIYAKTIEDTHKKLEDFFDIQDEMKVRIKQNELFIGTDVIYQGVGKDENLALFFFKDGLREIVFKKGISPEELQAFLEVLAFDFEREGIEEDVVTLLWEKDFQNIKYVVDEATLVEDEEYEEEAIRQVRGSQVVEDELKKAYQDATAIEEMHEVAVVQITEKDLKMLVRELEKDADDKKDKLNEILYDMLYNAESPAEYKDIVHILSNALEFSVKYGDISSAVDILRKAAGLYSNTSITEDLKRQIGLIFSYAGSSEIIKVIGELLDSGALVDENIFSEYIRYLPKSAILPFMTVLGELKTINARKLAINALTFLGSKDITTLAKGLKDERWYVVRNIIYILRRIGDKRVVEFLLKATRHDDIRVRKEVLRTLGELGGQGVAQTVKECLDDPEQSVRVSAIRALSNIGSDLAKRILIERIEDKRSIDLDFSEKKEYFEGLSRWKDNDVFELFIRLAKKRSIFKKAKNDELRACVAYGLGFLGNKDSLSVLYKLRDSKNKLLSEYAYSALKRIEYGR